MSLFYYHFAKIALFFGKHIVLSVKLLTFHKLDRNKDSAENSESGLRFKQSPDSYIISLYKSSFGSQRYNFYLKFTNFLQLF